MNHKPLHWLLFAIALLGALASAYNIAAAVYNVILVIGG